MRVPQQVQPSKPAPETASCRTSGELAEWVRRVGQLPEIRRDLIDRVRAEIAAGRYETPERIDAAVEAMLADLLDES